MKMPHGRTLRRNPGSGQEARAQAAFRFWDGVVESAQGSRTAQALDSAGRRVLLAETQWQLSEVSRGLRTHSGTPAAGGPTP